MKGEIIESFHFAMSLENLVSLTHYPSQQRWLLEGDKWKSKKPFLGLVIFL